MHWLNLSRKVSMSKLSEWYDSLDPHTKKYLDQQPLWHDRDLAKVAVISFVLGVILGVAL